MPTPKYTLKITLLGDGAVGKTSLRQRFMGARFPKNYLITIGADFSLTEKMIDEARVLYQVWDLAGQPSFKKVRELYYKGCYGALIVFDVTKESSIIELQEWVDFVKPLLPAANTPCGLISTKHDLERGIPEADVDDFRERNNISLYYPTSAKANQNVHKVFIALTMIIYEENK